MRTNFHPISNLVAITSRKARVCRTCTGQRVGHWLRLHRLLQTQVLGMSVSVCACILAVLSTLFPSWGLLFIIVIIFTTIIIIIIIVIIIIYSGLCFAEGLTVLLYRLVSGVENFFASRSAWWSNCCLENGGVASVVLLINLHCPFAGPRHCNALQSVSSECNSSKLMN